MAGAKVIVLYPTPPDVDAFERTYLALQAAAGSASAQKVVAHAISISSGGKPVFLVAQEETKTF